VVAVIYTAACLAMLVDKASMATTWMYFAGFLLIRRTDLQTQVSGKELAKLIGCLAVCIPAVVLMIYFQLEPKLERIAHEPVFIIPFWALAMMSLILPWRKERRLAKEASQVG